MEKKVEIIARDIIKPTSPTPNDKRILNLSLLDILSSPMYTGALLFYAADPQNLLGFSTEETSLKLKKSLSHTLPIFYPLAGRIKGSFVECNDEGAVFIEARVDHLLSEFLKYSVPESLEQLVPVEARPREAVTWPVLLIQANFFSCGGLVITICTSHKITDATSLVMFIRGWAESSRGLGITLIPSFNASEFFPLPLGELPSKPMDHKVEVEEKNWVTKRFVFDASNVKKLRAKASSNLVKNPTRVEAVTALFWRCLTKASRLSSPTPRTSVLQILVNLRGKVNSLCENTIGNMLSLMILKNEEAKIETIQDVVDELRRAKEIFSLNCKDMSKSSSKIFELLEEIGKVHGRGTEVDLWMSNSWCKLGMYEADFGWGKPVWVTGRGTSNFKNFMLLIDTKDGEGIEAWITLTEEHMSLLECDQELLESASLNPPVLI
ncbi:PREDICTED: BAHD acyltransferase At5g47980-like [Camelina sativa]|uniref:BAHD acyltransferase At5g47980-like n=1 Tax=Camelina sativa TaxID=90675 RepID=A0ABM0WYK3_CAMSA|nr:PREDICTED: BAHD acyltransferase At5g47980-like [Camelina sativa]